MGCWRKHVDALLTVGTQKYQILILLKNACVEKTVSNNQYKVLEIYGFNTAENRRKEGYN